MQLGRHPPRSFITVATQTDRPPVGLGRHQNEGRPQPQPGPRAAGRHRKTCNLVILNVRYSIGVRYSTCTQSARQSKARSCAALACATRRKEAQKSHNPKVPAPLKNGRNYRRRSPTAAAASSSPRVVGSRFVVGGRASWDERRPGVQGGAESE